MLSLRVSQNDVEPCQTTSNNVKPSFMRSIIKYFIEHPTVVNLCLFLLVGIGVFQVMNTRTTNFPSQRVRYVDVSVPYPGATPTEVEEGITIKIEETLQSVDGIDRITSASLNNLSTVTIELAEESETNTVVAEAKNAIDKIANFPDGAEAPIVEKREIPNLALAFVLTGDAPLSVKSDYANQIENDLLSQRGISDIMVSGTPREEIEIAVREEALSAYNLSFQQLALAVRAANLNTFGGEIKTGTANITLKTDSKGYYARELEDLVVAAGPNGGTVRLGDVATIRDQFADEPGARYLGEERVVQITVNALQDEDVLQNAETARAYLDDFNATHRDLQLKITEDGTRQVTDRIKSMVSSGVTGAILVLVVLALFLNRYLAFWVALKIPIAVIASFLITGLDDLTINVVSLFGFILVLGILVDDGVVVGENIYRWAREKGEPPLKAALEGTMEMVVPILISISTTAVAFSLFFFLPTTAGEFFGEIAFVVIAVLIMALIESFFFLPAHLAHSKAINGEEKISKIERGFNNSINWLRDRGYRPLVERLTRTPWLNGVSLLLFVGLLVGSLALVATGTVKFTFFPNLDDDAIFIELRMPAGTPEAVTTEKLQSIQAAAERANEKLSEGRDADLIQFVEIVTGPRPNQGQLRVTYLGGEQREESSFELTEAIRREAPPIPEAESLVYGLGASTALFGKPVAFSLQGNDLDQVRAARDELRAAMEAHPDLKDVSDNDQTGVREIVLTLKETARNLGLDLASVMNQIRAAYFGIEVQSVQRGEEEVEIWLRYPTEGRRDEAQLLDMRIAGPNGGNYPLREVANLEYSTGMLVLNRGDGERQITVDANVADLTVSAPTVINELIASTLDPIERKYPGVVYELEGQNRMSFKMTEAIGSVGPIILLLVLGLVVLNFNSFSQAFVVFLLYPFAFIGVVLGHMLHGTPLNIFSVVGTIALIGVFTNDSLVFISTFNQELEEGKSFTDALKEAARTRFRPIVLTTITTVAGLAPLVVSSSLGAQFLKGPALAISYGLGVGVFTLLVLLPTFLLFANRLRRFSHRIFHRKAGKPTATQVEPAVRNLRHRIGGAGASVILMLLFAGTGATTLNAQDLLPLQAAVDLALAENPELRVLGYDRQISQNNIDPAMVGKRPTVTASGRAYVGYADARVQTINLAPGGGESEPIDLNGVQHGVSASPEVSWLVFDGGRSDALLDQLRLVDRSTALQIEATREWVVAQTTLHYLRVGQLQRQLELDAENIELTAERLARTARDEQYGIANSLRRLNAQVDLNNDSLAYRSTLLDLENARRDLNRTLGRDPETPLRTVPPGDFAPTDLRYEDLRQLLDANNEQLELARQRIALSQNQLVQTENANPFTVQLYANATGLSTVDNANFLQENRNFGAQAGIRFSKTLWDGGKNKIDQENARLRIERDQRDLDQTRLDLETQLRQAYATYQNALDQLALQRTNLPTFERNYEKTLADFRLGQVDGTAVRTAQTNLTAARTRVALLEFRTRSAEVDLLGLTGTLVQ